MSHKSRCASQLTFQHRGLSAIKYNVTEDVITAGVDDANDPDESDYDNNGSIKDNSDLDSGNESEEGNKSGEEEEKANKSEEKEDWLESDTTPDYEDPEEEDSDIDEE